MRLLPTKEMKKGKETKNENTNKGNKTETMDGEKIRGGGNT